MKFVKINQEQKMATLSRFNIFYSLQLGNPRFENALERVTELNELSRNFVTDLPIDEEFEEFQQRATN